MDSEQLREHVAEIERSGRLGKSQAYGKLLNYLMERSLEGPPPKEIEIAIEVFGRDADFDVSHDALVRVYVHKLRKKLRDFYDHRSGEQDFYLEIPRGSYRLDMIPSGGSQLKRDFLSGRGLAYTLASVALIFGVLLVYLLTRPGPVVDVGDPQRIRTAESFIWSDILSDPRPITVVLGDLFVFSEINEFSEEVREIRDFGINSEADLSMYLDQNPELAHRYRSFGISFLPPNVALSLRHVMPILLTSRRDTQTKMVSQLTAEDIETSNIIYVGLLTSLGSAPELRDRVLGGSRYEAHTSYEILVDRVEGDIFAGEGDIGLDYSERYVDYALVSRINLAAGGKILAITAVRDAGLEQVLGALTDPDVLDELSGQAMNQGIIPGVSFEILYEITGFGLESLEVIPRHIDVISTSAIGGTAASSLADQGSSQ